MQIKILEKLYAWYGKKTVLSVVALVLVLAVAGFVYKTKSTQTDPITETLPPLVTVDIAGNLASNSSLRIIGSVEAVSQAELKSEVGGRVTVVNSQLGATVSAGAVLAQLENANERAAVLQAEGSYEAALAAANQSDLSVSQAENNLKTAQSNVTAAKDAITSLSQSSYTTANEIVVQQMDQFYINPRVLEPRLRIDPRTQENYLVTERIRFRTMLEDWRVSSFDTSLDARETLASIEANTKAVIGVVDVFIALLPREDDSPFFSDAQLEAALANFTAARSQLNTILSAVNTNRANLNSAEQALASAEEALLQAQIGGTGGDVSAADAQVKQALGALRSAQANLAKTIISTPIAGEVNELTVKVGDFVSPQTTIATVANNNALEVTAFVGSLDRERLAVGQTVRIDGLYEGVVTTIANAINPSTKKYEVKIATESDQLTNGNTVLIELTESATVSTDTLYVPITAIKFTNTAGAVFVVENEILVQKSVEIGKIQGDFVEITNGISATDEIVVDVRGLVSGQQVEVITE